MEIALKQYEKCYANHYADTQFTLTKVETYSIVLASDAGLLFENFYI